MISGWPYPTPPQNDDYVKQKDHIHVAVAEIHCPNACRSISPGRNHRAEKRGLFFFALLPPRFHQLRERRVRKCIKPVKLMSGDRVARGAHSHQHQDNEAENPHPETKPASKARKDERKGIRTVISSEDNVKHRFFSLEK